MLFCELIKKIEEIAPLANAAAWDKSGLQVASHKTEIHALGVCLDPMPQLIERALDMGADCLLSHHPLAISPVLPSRLDWYHETLRLLLSTDTPLYAAHTSLDTNPNGPAGWLARELQLANLSLLESVSSNDANAQFGYGLVGDLPNPLAPDDLYAFLAQHIDVSTARISGSLPDKVCRIAYCTGSGASLCDEAFAANADVYITGDIKYHTALANENAILDVGHHGLEEEMMRRMALLLESFDMGIKMIFIPSNSPFKCFVA